MVDPSRRHPEEISNVLREYIRHEMDAVPTASLARLVAVDEETRRGRVEVIPDGTVVEHVPIATPFAADGSGDIMPINPEETDQPVKGLVIYVHHELDPYLAGEGSMPAIDHDHAVENAIFIPAMVWLDRESVPEHGDDDRLIEHPNGATVRMNDESLTVSHPMGGEIEIGGIPEQQDIWDDDIDDPTLADPARDLDEEDEYVYFPDPDDFDLTPEEEEEMVIERPDPHDYTTWPAGNEGDRYAKISHESGAEIVITDTQIAINPTDDHELTVGQPNDADRWVADGPYQHVHPIYHGDGTVSLAGKPLSFREFIAVLTEGRRDWLVNADAHWLTEAEVYAEAYLAWLRDHLDDHEISPTDPKSWPEPEPMPPVSPRELFADPTPDARFRARNSPVASITPSVVKTGVFSGIGTGIGTFEIPIEREGEFAGLGIGRGFVEGVSRVPKDGSFEATGIGISLVLGAANRGKAVAGEGAGSGNVSGSAVKTARFSGTGTGTGDVEGGVEGGYGTRYGQHYGR